MELRTSFPSFKGAFEINHECKLQLMGSCFSIENGRNLNCAGFQTLINPLGVFFNPTSIGHSLQLIVRNKKLNENDFFERDGNWYSFKLHSSITGKSLKEALQFANEQIEQAHRFFFNSNVLIITFGTAWVYENIETGKIVANCHKVNPLKFQKRKLGLNEIIAEYTQLIEHLKSANPSLKIIFTISPVKHLKDGYIENNWSKSTLNIAIHELVRRFDFVDYFPAYEIMNDDLRDYRFYKDDMVHPNELAIKYIYEYFIKAYCCAETVSIANEFMALATAAGHKIMNRGTEEHKKFSINMRSRAEKLVSINRVKAEELMEKF